VRTSLAAVICNEGKLFAEFTRALGNSVPDLSGRRITALDVTTWGIASEPVCRFGSEKVYSIGLAGLSVVMKEESRA